MGHLIQSLLNRYPRPVPLASIPLPVSRPHQSPENPPSRPSFFPLATNHPPTQHHTAVRPVTYSPAPPLVSIGLSVAVKQFRCPAAAPEGISLDETLQRYRTSPPICLPLHH